MRGCFESAGLNQKSQEGRRADYAVLAELSRGLGGGDILNICVNAICVRENQGQKRRIGFQPDCSAATLPSAGLGLGVTSIWQALSRRPCA